MRPAPMYALLGTIGSGMMIFCGYFLNRALAWIGVVSLLLVVLLSGVILLQWLALCRRRLLLNIHFLEYDRFRIPWSVVSDISILDGAAEQCVGVVLKEPIHMTAVRPSPFTSIALRKLSTCGALPISRARGMSVEQLRSEISKYWLSAVRSVPRKSN